jgi:hypothetical protein
MKSNVVMSLAGGIPIDIAGTIDNFVSHLYIHGGAGIRKSNSIPGSVQ